MSVETLFVEIEKVIVFISESRPGPVECLVLPMVAIAIWVVAAVARWVSAVAVALARLAVTAVASLSTVVVAGLVFAVFVLTG